MEKFTEILDEALKEINSDYEAKRYSNMTLMLPKVHKAKKDCSIAMAQEKRKIRRAT